MNSADNFSSAADRFSTAVATIAALVAAEAADPAIDPQCLPFTLHHGHKTDRAIILFHGFTNCPRQFAQLADVLFESGYNVYVPRLPRHGLRDKLTSELAGLTADELAACATRAAQIGADLGAKLSVMGLSVGATLAAWLAQTQPLDRALAIAPFLSIVRVPALIEPAVAGVLSLAPNVEVWWDPRVKEHIGPAHAYPRFATHALAQCLQFGEDIRRLAHESAPRAALCVLVLNAKDPAIDNGAARELWSEWQTHGGVTQEYTFENLDTRHDIIEPATYPEASTLVYPVLLQLLGA